MKSWRRVIIPLLTAAAGPYIIPTLAAVIWIIVTLMAVTIFPVAYTLGGLFNFDVELLDEQLITPMTQMFDKNFLEQWMNLWGYHYRGCFIYDDEWSGSVPHIYYDEQKFWFRAVIATLLWLSIVIMVDKGWRKKASQFLTETVRVR